MNKQKEIIIGIVVVLALSGILYYFYMARQSEESALDSEVRTELEAEAEKLNPFVLKPVNPFAKSANPYENIKTNPFE